MLQMIDAWEHRSGNARRSDHAVVEEHNVFWARLSNEMHACSHGRHWVFWVWLAFWSMFGFSGCHIKGDWVHCGGRCVNNGVGGG